MINRMPLTLYFGLDTISLTYVRPRPIRRLRRWVADYAAELSADQHLLQDIGRLFASDAPPKREELLFAVLSAWSRAVYRRKATRQDDFALLREVAKSVFGDGTATKTDVEESTPSHGPGDGN